MKAFCRNSKLWKVTGLFITLLFVILTTPGVYGNTGDRSLETSLSSQDMFCRPNIQLSLGVNGDSEITPQMLLMGNYPDYSVFVVEIIDPPTGDNIATCEMAETSITVMVTDTSSQPTNSCWSTVHVEDKLPPIIQCSTLVVPCNTDLASQDPDYFLGALYDNCTDEEDIDLWYSETLTSLSCASPYALQVDRVWHATDEYGNESTCQQTIYLERPSLASIEIPDDITLECPAGSTDPSETGEPTLFGDPLASICGIMNWYDDQIVPLCGNSYKIERTWTLMNWCTGATVNQLQLIHVLDTEPPVMNCPGDLTVTTHPSLCGGFYTVPQNLANDACAADGSIQYTIKVDGMISGTTNVQLEVGEHDLRVIASDPCGNVDSCDFTVTVVDDDEPYLLCQTTSVALGTQQQVTLSYRDFHDLVVSDNCGVLDTMVRRVLGYCDDPQDLVFGDSVTFCCDDVGEDVMVAIKVRDIYGNAQICMIGVEVQDLIPPEIQCPAELTITCDQLEDSLNLGMATATDNCNATIQTFETGSLDECLEGVLMRTYVAIDDFGNTDTCTQEITVINPFNFEMDSVIWPHDTIIAACDANPHPDSLGMAPDLNQDICNSVSISYTDSIPDPDSVCLVIYRQWTVYDSCDMAGADSVQTIVILNNNDPLLDGPDNVTVYVPDTACEVIVDLPPVTANSCSFGLTIVNNYNGQGADIQDTFETGVTFIIYTATDSCGNQSNWNVVVTVFDTIDPVIDCPADITASNDPGQCDADVTIPPPVTSDNCGIALVDNDYNGGADASGNYPVGTTVVTWTVTDVNGNTATCSTSVTVNDDEDPQISCPSDTLAENDPGLCGADITLPLPDTSDNCGIVSVNNDFSGGLDASGFYPVGITVVTWTVEDGSGNVATCNTTVEVVDVEDPVIDCPGDITANTDADLCGATLNIPLPDTSDNCAVESVENDFNGGYDASGFYPVGTTVVTWIITDVNGNVDSCSTSITVVDSVLPVIDCPADLTIGTDPGVCQADVTVPLPDTSDNCGIDTVFNDLNGGYDASGIYPVGTTVVTWTVIDINGNSSTCSTAVTVEDDEDPSISCPPDVTVDADSDMCSADVTLALPDTSDNCGVDSVFNDYNGGFDGSGNYPVGTTIVTWTVIDVNGNSATCSTSVTVGDSNNLSIICPPDTSVSTDPGECSAFINLPLPVPMDNCGVESVDNDFNGGIDASGTYPVGQTTVIWTVTDSSGNTATCSTVVTVTDDEDPLIICPSDTLVSTDQGVCEAFVTIPLPDTSDNCGVDSVFNDYNGGFDASDTYPVGTTVVTWIIIDDSGNSDTCSMSVTVEDNEAPFIACPPDTVVSADQGMCDAFVTIPLPDTSDNCGIDSVVNDYNGGFDASDTYPVGTTVVTWTITDLSGNTSTCSTTITVEDTGAPGLACPPDVTAENDEGLCAAEVLIPLPDTSDMCGTVDSLFNDYNGGLDASDEYPVGVTVVTYTAIDENGNSSTCSFTVTVIDTMIPVITCPADISVANDPGECNADVTVPLPDTSDNCGVDSVYNDYNGGFDASDNYPVGVTIVTWVIIDVNGNADSCSTTITVADTSAPVIVECPDDVTIDCSSSYQSLDIFGTADASDNCEVIEVQDTVYNINPCNNTGEIIRTWTFSDSAGNSSVCTQTIFITGDLSVLDSLDFIWPSDSIVVDACDDLNPDSIPDSAPVLDPAIQTCNQIGIDYTDSTDFGPSEGCFDILRTWTVTDSCNLDTLTGAGQWMFLQVITAVDTTPPLFIDTLSADTFYVGPDSTCTAVVDLDPVVAFDCSGIDSISNNSAFADSSGADASGFYPPGTHTITFIAVDVCGNMDSTVLSFVVLDTFPPTFGCVKMEYAIEDDLEAEVLARTMVTSLFDNCTDPDDILVSFSADDPYDTLRIVPCDSVPGSPVEFPITLYVFDEYFNVDSCPDTFGIIDPNMFCPPQPVTIAGALYTPETEGIGFADIMVNGIWEAETNIYGNYTIDGLFRGDPVVIRPKKRDEWLKGLTTYDVVLIQRHILGISPFSSGYQYIAADVDRSGEVNIMDIVELRKLLLGITNQFTNNDSYRFMPTEHPMTEDDNPLLFGFPEQIEFYPIRKDELRNDFVGIKIGDVSGVITRSSRSAPRFKSRHIFLEPTSDHYNEGEEIEITIYIEDQSIMTGFQFALQLDQMNVEWDPGLQFTQPLLDAGHVHFDEARSTLRVSWNGSGSMMDGADFVMLRGRSKAAVSTEDLVELTDLMAPEAYDRFMGTYELDLVIAGDEGENRNEFVLFQNEPNPYSEGTIIRFGLPKDQSFTLSVFDARGGLVIERKGEGKRGINLQEIEREELGEAGIYYYRLQTANGTATKKMILVNE